jgi:hypothetical protein
LILGLLRQFPWRQGRGRSTISSRRISISPRTSLLTLHRAGAEYDMGWAVSDSHGFEQMGEEAA